jgi:hypothetical protein
MYQSFRNIFNIRIILGAILFAMIVFALFLGILWTARGKTNPQAPATALFSIIEAPTGTPTTPAIAPTPTLNPNSTREAVLPGIAINIGDFVQVSGTGGDGLRLHLTPGVSGDVDYVAIDSEVFIIKDGPVDSDGYYWWLLRDPYSEKTLGWGVADYLSVVQNP